VTKNIIITASEIKQGDKIAVTLREKSYEDRPISRTYTGVADSVSGNNVWRTEKRWNLYAHEEGAVIELLDRPIPTVTVPDRKQAIVKYDVSSFDPWKPERIAHRNGSGKWAAYDAKGERMDTHLTDEDFGRFLAAGAHKHEVIFAGVAE